MTEPAFIFPLPGSYKPHTVVLYRKNCIQNISILCKATKHKYTEDFKCGHFIIL